MKTMKKVLLVLLSFVLVLSMAGAVAADTITDDTIGTTNTGTSDITATVGSKYTVTLPDTITAVGSLETATAADIKFSNILLNTTETVEVTVTEPTVLELTHADGESKISYSLKTSEDSAVTIGTTVVASVTASQNNQAEYVGGGVKAQYSGTIPKAGTYSGTVTFTVTFKGDTAA